MADEKIIIGRILDGSGTDVAGKKIIPLILAGFWVVLERTWRTGKRFWWS